jgi:hypothetical protein
MSDQPGADLTTQNTYNRQTSIPPAGFKPANPASKLPQTHTLNLAATGIGRQTTYAARQKQGFADYPVYAYLEQNGEIQMSVQRLTDDASICGYPRLSRS